MKKIIFTLLFCSGNLFAQNIQLKYAVLNPTNTTPLKEMIAKECYQGKFYAMVQFANTTSQQQREAISAKTGIAFSMYIPTNTFMASIPITTNFADLQKMGISKVVEYKSYFKIDKKLGEKPLPAWIEQGNGNIEINVLKQAGIDKNIFANEITSKGFQFVKWINNDLATLIINEKQLTQLSEMPIVAWIEAGSAPARTENFVERTNHRVNVIDQAYSTGLHYDGTGVTIAIGDNGPIGPHIDYTGRVQFDPNIGANLGNHADHVSGIAGGAGNMDPLSTGHAKGANLRIYSDYDNVTSASTDYSAHSVRILSNSLGQVCNAGYDANSVTLDQLINAKTSLISVHSAGNSGGSNCGGVAGYYEITGGIKACKNAITVGNVNSDDSIDVSSSRGPANDGRLMPAVCAVGTNVYSTIDTNAYDTFTGTSMACPAVAGTLADLFQAYKAFNAGAEPNNQVLKAIIMNSADDLGNPGPDFTYGYGRINARRAYNDIIANRIIEDTINNGSTKTYNITVPNNLSALKVMVYWNDVEGNLISLNPLVNNIDFRLKKPSNSWVYPWVLNPGNTVALLNANAVSNAATLDSINNQEQVTLQLPNNGTYQVSVNGKNIPFGPQKFVIVYDFVERGVILTYPKGGEHMVANKTERIRWDANGTYATFDLDYSTDAGASWTNITTGIAANLRYYDWTVPNIQTGKALIRVTKGGATSISDTNFSIYPVPQNLRVDTACIDNFTLTWDSVAGATSYTAYILGAKYMDVAGTSTTNSFTFTGVNVTDSFYVSVSANNSTLGAKGQRAYTVIKVPGYKHCSDTVDLTITKMTSAYSDTMFNCALPDSTPITITVKNIYATGICRNPVAYLQVNNGTIISNTIVANIGPGDSVNYTFVTNIPYLSTPGNYILKSWVVGDNDINVANDTATQNITMLASTVYNQPFQQTFDTTVFAPDNWMIKNNFPTNQRWNVANVIGKSGTSTKAAEMQFYLYSLANTDILQTPIVFVTPNISTAFINFDLAHAPASTTDNDALQLWISTDCGTTFSPMSYNKVGTALQTTSAILPNFAPTSADQWRTESVSLANYINQKVIIQFRAMNTANNNLYIDNVNIQATTNPLAITEEENSVLKMYPNPTQGNSTLELYTYSAQDLQINITNAVGQILSTQKVKTVTGFNSFTLKTENLPSGLYIIDMQNSKWHKEMKLIKK